MPDVLHPSLRRHVNGGIRGDAVLLKADGAVSVLLEANVLQDWVVAPGCGFLVVPRPRSVGILPFALRLLTGFHDVSWHGVLVLRILPIADAGRVPVVRVHSITGVVVHRGAIPGGPHPLGRSVEQEPIAHRPLREPSREGVATPNPSVRRGNGLLVLLADLPRQPMSLHGGAVHLTDGQDHGGLVQVAVLVLNPRLPVLGTERSHDPVLRHVDAPSSHEAIEGGGLLQYRGALPRDVELAHVDAPLAAGGSVGLAVGDVRRPREVGRVPAHLVRHCAHGGGAPEEVPVPSRPRDELGQTDRGHRHPVHDHFVLGIAAELVADWRHLAVRPRIA